MKPMKKYALLAVLFLLCIFPAACGKKEDAGDIYRGIAPGTEDLSAITDRLEYYDITVEAEGLFDLDLWDKIQQNQSPESAVLRGGRGYLQVGTQFFMGEPVQLWAELSSKGSDIYLYREAGERELVLQGIPIAYTASSGDYKWYIDRDGGLYCYCSIVYVGENRTENIVIKFLPTGEILYKKKLDFAVRDFCQTEDGKIYLLLWDGEEKKQFVAELDPATGETSSDSYIEIPFVYGAYLGSAGASPVVAGYAPGDSANQIMKVDTADGSLTPVLYLTGTSYGWHRLDLMDFRVPEDGQVELLWTDSYGRDCLWESLRMEKVERTPIVVRGVNDAIWLADRIARFNRGNDTFHVVMETCGSGNDGEDFARLTSIQLGSGKGPDILLADLGLDFAGLLEKGVLEDLAPYMEASGIREEDYFPFVFSTWRQGEKIYGVNYNMDARGMQIKEEVLGSRRVPDIEALADALLAWEGDGICRKGYGSGAVLEFFLQGTESLWGMVDWQEDRCDFNTSLFGKLLEAARRYGDDGRKNPESAVMEELELDTFFRFDRQAEQRKEGKVTCGVLFDDGCHAAASARYAMAVNANSLNKEGAWEFIAYLLSEECQSIDVLLYMPPVHREAFKKWLPAIIERWGIRHTVNGAPVYSVYFDSDVSEEKQEEYIKAIEDARPLPLRTAPILAIILEEAEDYFSGSKSAEEVSGVINNRVQLYLDERK